MSGEVDRLMRLKRRHTLLLAELRLETLCKSAARLNSGRLGEQHPARLQAAAVLQSEELELCRRGTSALSLTLGRDAHLAVEAPHIPRWQVVGQVVATEGEWWGHGTVGSLHE